MQRSVYCIARARAAGISHTRRISRGARRYGGAYELRRAGVDLGPFVEEFLNLRRHGRAVEELGLQFEVGPHLVSPAILPHRRVADDVAAPGIAYDRGRNYSLWPLQCVANLPPAQSSRRRLFFLCLIQLARRATERG